MILEISLVSSLLLLNLSHFLKFVMVDVKSLSIEYLLRNLLLGYSSIIWGLVANKGVESITLLGEYLDTFDFTILLEVLSKFSFGGSGREVLNVKVASLLGVLES